MSNYTELIKIIAKDTGFPSYTIHDIFSDAVEDYCPPRPFATNTPEGEIYHYLISLTETGPDAIHTYYHDEWMDIIKATVKTYKDEEIGKLDKTKLGFSWDRPE